MKGIEGVEDVHHLHVCTITSGLDAMSVHLVVSEPGREGPVLSAARTLAAERFGLGHSTIQVEVPAEAAGEPELHV